MTNMNPLRYQGIVRADEDDAGLSAEDQNNKTNISCPMFKFAVSPAQVIAVTGVIMLIICTVILAITVNINTTISSMPISSESSNRIDLNSLYAKGSTTSQLQLYSSWDSRGLYFRVSADLVDNGQNFLLYEQLTSGVGVRELFCDAGSIISSDVVIFRKCSSGQLQLLIVQQGYRSDAMVMHRSFSNPIVWAFEILDVNRDGYLINLDEFSKSPIGNLHNNGIPATIASAFGQQFVYSFDKERSFVETDLSNANFYRARIHRNISYSLVNGVSPPAGLDKTITISSRIVLVVLDKYRDAEFSVYAGEHAAHFPDVEESVHFRAQKPTRQSSGQQERVAVSSATLPLQAAKYKYAPRPYHPMSGFNLISFMNESAPLLEAREEHYIVRHFLVNPTEATPDSVGLHKATDRATSAASAAPTVPTTNNSNSAPHAHIVYYVDQDTPAGIREALVEGISWWDEAFQYAGYPKNTFIVKAISREQFDPYDVTVPRRSFVEWVDRNLRSYSLGIRLEDPRSGEILKGHVRIENLRMRQDALIAEALLGPFEETEEQSTTALASASAAAHRELSLLHRLALRRATTSALGDSEGEVAASAESAFPPLKAAAEAATGATSSSLVESILAAIMQRVRQLGAHEVGHTLGLAHNFAGSTYPQGYASVMDYPPPIVTVDPSGAKLILNEKSYANGIGFFDKVAIDYGYRQLDANLSWTEQKHVLGELIQTAVKSGYVYLTDQDSAVSGLDWRDTQWDSGTDPVEALRHSLQVRALAMRKIASDTVLPEHAARSRLQELFPIVYLWHRYEVQAAVKLVAGGLFQYSLKEVATAMGAKVQPVPAELQKSAFRQVSVGACCMCTVPCVNRPHNYFELYQIKIYMIYCFSYFLLFYL